MKGRPVNPVIEASPNKTMKTHDAHMLEESQRDLAAGVLRQATQDLRRFHRGTSRVERELYDDAYSWVMANEFSWPFSFLNVCGALSLAPERVRGELLSDLSLGRFRYWTRRCGRTARRFRLALTQFFASESGIQAADQAFPESTAIIPI